MPCRTAPARTPCIVTVNSCRVAALIQVQHCAGQALVVRPLAAAQPETPRGAGMSGGSGGHKDEYGTA